MNADAFPQPSPKPDRLGTATEPQGAPPPKWRCRHPQHKDLGQPAAFPRKRCGLAKYFRLGNLAKKANTGRLGVKRHLARLGREKPRKNRQNRNGAPGKTATDTRKKAKGRAWRASRTVRLRNASTPLASKVAEASGVTGVLFGPETQALRRDFDRRCFQ